MRFHILLLLLILPIITAGYTAVPWKHTEAYVLLKFKRQLSNTSAIKSWTAADDPCSGNVSNWIAVRCNENGEVIKLLLGGMGLSGYLDLGTLAGLPRLRALNLQKNNFQGQISDVNLLPSLRKLYMSYNKFSGAIPSDAFKGMSSLEAVELAGNMLTGEIPVSLAGLPRLTNLTLEWNSFVGNIPDFKNRLSVFNVRGNKLEGRIPASLSSQPASVYEGNVNLCGAPLPLCKEWHIAVKELVGVVSVAAATLAIVVALLFIRYRRRKSNHIAKTQSSQFGKPKESRRIDKFRESGKSWDSPKRTEGGKLHFVRFYVQRFELNELLRASAEVLGSGSFGSSYKAVLAGGPSMVVKRFRNMNSVGKEEFIEHMRRLGRLSHPNVLPLIAFCYEKEDKLLISEYVRNGSLAAHLHARRASGEKGLNWGTRLKIVKGVARGLAYLHGEFAHMAVPHGHLKSSNVLLDGEMKPVLGDYGLVPVVNKARAQQIIVAYKSPEFERASRKMDVWCLGILILEVLTGKLPTSCLRVGKGGDESLADWVRSAERGSEVFEEMEGAEGSEEEMMKLLRIGMGCAEWRLEKRWQLEEAVARIDMLRDALPASSNSNNFSQV